jgi:hypothetical protein
VGATLEHFNVANAQILWIGEKNQMPGATDEDKETVTEELGAMEADEKKNRIPEMESKGWSNHQFIWKVKRC